MKKIDEREMQKKKNNQKNKDRKAQGGQKLL